MQSEVEIYSPSEASLALEKYQRQLARFFSELVDEWGPSVVFASDNGVKMAALQYFLGHFGNSTNFRELRLISQNPESPEPAVSQSSLAALNKVREVKVAAGPQGEHTLYVAGDVIFHQQDLASDRFRPSHKLARVTEGPLTEQQRDLVLDRLLTNHGQLLSEDKQAEVRRAIWSVSSGIVNGQEEVLTNLVELRYKPIDQELIREVFNQVVESGLVLHINTVIPLLETIILSGVESVAIAPQRLVKEYGLEAFRREANHWQVPLPEDQLKTGQLDMKKLAEQAPLNYWSTVLINVLGNVPAPLDN